MKVALLVLESGITLISYTDELEYEPKCHLWKPHTISGKTKVAFSSWPEYSEDDHVLLNSERLLTVCTPTQDILDKYVAKVGKPPLTKKPEPVILNEEQSLPEFPADDDYEPRYIEE